MGSGASSLQILSSNELLQKYVGTDHISHADPFWMEFLASSWLSKVDYNSLENLEYSEPSIMRQFKKHNVKTQNLGSLVRFIVTRGSVLASTAYSPDSFRNMGLVVQNAVLVFRISAKYLLEHTAEQAFIKHLAGSVKEVSKSSTLEDFFYTLFLLLTKLPVNSETYPLHCEIQTAMLILLASQMYRPLSSPLSLIFAYAIWGKCAQIAPAVVHRLLNNFSENLPAPPGLMGRPGQSSFMWRAASSLAGSLLTIVTLGYANRSSSQPTTHPFVQSDQKDSKTTASQPSDLITSEPLVRSDQGCHLLAEQSALLLLVLTTQAGSVTKCANLPQELGLDSETPTINPYRTALFSLKGKHNVPQSNDCVSEPTSKAVPKLQPGGAMLRGIVSIDNPEMDAFPIDFTAFRDTAAQTMHQDSSTLLLYLLVHRNTHFQTFLLQNQNYEKLLLPLMNVLYRSPSDSSHLVYMALIIILILTENEAFGQEIHTSLINWVDWSPSRRLTSISRGSLIILVLIRTIRYHLNQLKDKYLHVNILAALANLSAKVKNMHPHVSDSFLGLLQLLTKRYNRTVEQLQRLSAKSGSNQIDDIGTDAYSVKEVAATAQTNADNSLNGENTEESMVHELSLLEEVIRMILEILNSVLTHVLSDNCNLIYSLLYQRDCLTALRSHPSFQNVIQNLDTILTFFSNKIEQEVGDNLSSPEQLLSVINRHSSNVYRNCNLKKFPDLKFKYVEEESPDDFFIPYVWSVVLRQSGIAFRTDQLRLFASEPDSTSLADGQPDPDDDDNDANHIEEHENQNVAPISVRNVIV